MKKILSFLAAVMALTACNKEFNKVGSDLGQKSEEKVPVSVSIRNVATKAGESGPEDIINSLTVILYRIVDGAKTYESFYEFMPSASEGTIYIDPSKEADSYYIAAYANVEGLSTSSYNQDWTRFSEESIGDFQMFGEFTKAKDDLLSSGKAEVSLQRQCSKVTVEKISLEWINAANAHKQFKVKSLYLMDVPGVFENVHKASFDLDSRDLWYNTNGYDKDGDQDVLLYSKATDIIVTETAAYDTDHTFYGYISSENAVNSTASWKPSDTRLVIEADFDGETCYYAIRINRENLEKVRNKHFVFKNIVITRPGADEPYEALTTEEDIIVTLAVSPWEVKTYDRVEVI